MKTLLTILLFIVGAGAAQAQQTVGLFDRTPASQDGYVLFSPLFSRFTFLIDKCGKEVHRWESQNRPGNSVYLLPDGKLLRTGNTGNIVFNAATPGGLIEKRDWNNTLLWSYTISTPNECQHHDICVMPNGNILALVWERKTRAEAIAAGRDSTKLSNYLWAEKIVELEPTGTNGAKILWVWNAWDHLIQDRDPSLQNYGVVADHPELVNINHPNSNPTNPDWLHMNSVAYNADLDQIMVSTYGFDEFWVVDHSTSKTQVATHSGGKQNKGGDLVYRWGNPAAYHRGTAVDKMLFVQHTAHWIPKGYPDAGKIMVFSNGQNRPEGDFSSVVVVDPPVDSTGHYQIVGNAAYGPSLPFWEYKAPIQTDFYSPILSGAERLPNGNTLICEGTKGHFFEVDPAGNKVWSYINPVGISGAGKQGNTPQQNLVFRCTQYPINYSGFAGRKLESKQPLEIDPLNYDCMFSANPTSIASQPAEENIFRAANPFSGSIQLSCLGGSPRTVQAVLVSAMGQVCARWELRVVNGGTQALEVPGGLATGMYLLRIEDGARTSTLKLQHD